METATSATCPGTFTDLWDFSHIPPVSDIPHCPNPECPYFHHHPADPGQWFKPHGRYHTDAFGTVPRFRCMHCRRTFSTQTFSIDYYVKHPVNYHPLIMAHISSSGQGALSRAQGLRQELIQNRYERAARCLMAIHSDCRRQLGIEECLVLDGFESFSLSQYFPNNINVLLGAKSEFWYSMGFSQLRRKGRMTDAQKTKRAILEAVLGKADPKSIQTSVEHLLEDLSMCMQENKIETITLLSDEHKAYVRAMRQMPHLAHRILHHTVSSKLTRDHANPLFSVNYLDRQLRKDQANHVRETVQFAHCPSAMMLRLSLYQMIHNYMMPRRVHDQRRGRWQTRAEYLGMSRAESHKFLKAHWGYRAFFHKCQLWKVEKTTWLMGWLNKGITMGRYVPKYILA